MLSLLLVEYSSGSVGLGEMTAPLALTMFLFGSASGVASWWYSTKNLLRRSFYDERPPGVSLRDYERAVVRRRKIWRIISTIFYTLLGAGLGDAIFLAFPGHH